MYYWGIYIHNMYYWVSALYIREYGKHIYIYFVIGAVALLAPPFILFLLRGRTYLPLDCDHGDGTF